MRVFQRAKRDGRHAWINSMCGSTLNRVVFRIDLVFSSFYSLSGRPKNEATLMRAVQAVQAVHINDEGDKKSTSKERNGRG